QNIMEILHERYVLIQTAFQQAWEEQSNLIISQTEWKIIGRLEQGELPVAQITKNLHITRQAIRSEEHTSELQSRFDLVCRLLLHSSPTYPLFPYTTLFRSTKI